MNFQHSIGIVEKWDEVLKVLKGGRSHVCLWHGHENSFRGEQHICTKQASVGSVSTWRQV